jgi:hypothetical protein
LSAAVVVGFVVVMAFMGLTEASSRSPRAERRVGMALCNHEQAFSVNPPSGQQRRNLSAVAP